LNKAQPNVNNCFISEPKQASMRAAAVRITAMHPRATSSTALRAWLAAVAVAICPAVLAQAPAASQPRSTVPAAAPPTVPAKPRTRIELPAAERQALGERTGPAPTADTPVIDELLPQAEDANRPNLDRPVTEIEQIRTGNRVTEIRVTPALTGRTYVIENRDQRQPITATGSTSGLTLPRLFTWEFGRPDERSAPPAGSAPPPPSSQTR
jgi:hypothetical protein